MLTLTTSAEEITTNNLLPNSGDGVDWNSSSTDQINPGGSGYVSNGSDLNGFTVTCATSQANCGYKWSVGGDFEVTGTATLSKNDIALTNTDRTQDMLDNGITLNNYIDVANCDHEAGNCEGDSGNTDSHTVTIKLKNSSGTVLSTTTQTRTDIDGFKGNCNGYPSSSLAGVSAACGQYNDTVIYNNTGSNKVDWSWSGTDNNTGTASRGGPNLLGAKLTMTYNNTVIDNEIIEEIEDIFEEIDTDIIEEFFEEETFTFDEEPQFEMEMGPTFEDFTFAEEFVEDFFMEMDEEFFMEETGMEFEDGPMIEFTDTEMEEINEESNEIVATYLPVVSEEEEFSSEESFAESDGSLFMEPTEDGEGFATETFQEEEVIEEEPMMEEEMAEESTEMAEEEVMEEENTEMAEEEAVEEESTEMVEAENEETFEEETQEEESTSETATASTVQNEKLAKQKKIRQKKAIVKNLDRIMDKVDKDIKDIAKNLAIKNIIKMDAMTSEQASLAMYQNTLFYKPKNIYLNQLNIFDNRQIYPNTNLATYVQNDKMEIKARKLGELNLKKQQLLYELEMLKNGQT